MGRVVLEAAILRRVMGRRDNDAVRQPILPPAIVRQDGMREHRRGSVAQLRVHHYVHAACSQHLQRRVESRPRERMRILHKKQWAVYALPLAVPANRLRDGQDVVLVEGTIERRAAVAGGAETDALGTIAGVGPYRVVSRDETVNIDEHGRWGGLSRQRIDAHALSLARSARPDNTVKVSLNQTAPSNV